MEEALSINQQVDEKIDSTVSLLTESQKITTENKQQMFKVVRVVLENFFNGQKPTPEMFFHLPEVFKTTDCKVYVSFYKQGELRACYSGGEKGDTLLVKLIQGTLNAIADKRFGGVIQHSELNDLYIDLTMMLNPRRYKGKTVSQLKKYVELGYHSIQLSCDGKQAFFKSSVPIKKNYDFTKTFRRLAKKAGLDENVYDGADHVVTVYDTLQFMENFESRYSNNAAISMIRGNKITYQSMINRFQLEQSLRMAGDYMVRHTTKLGRMTYNYKPYEDDRVFSKVPVGVLRCLASIWILAEIANYFSDEHYRSVAKRALSYMIEQFYCYESDSHFGYIKVKDNANIGAAGFLMLGLLAIGEDGFYADVKQSVTRFILAMVDSEGGFLYPVYLPDKATGFDTKQLYYPGEALTALMYLYQKELHYPYLQVVENVCPYYLDLFRKSDSRINMAAWMSKAYAKVFAATGKQYYADFVFEMNDVVLTYQKGLETPYVDRIGCFSHSGNSSATGVFVESLAEGLSVAKYIQDADRIQRYSEAMWLGMRYIQQMQYHPEECKPFPHADKILGGIRSSLFDSEIRMDNVQHCACAMLKTLQGLDCRY